MYVELIVIALAAALSPIVIAAFLKVVFAEQRATAVPAFVLVLGLLAFGLPLAVGRIIGAATGYDAGEQPATALDVILAALIAVVLAGLAARNLRKSRSPSTAAVVRDAGDDGGGPIGLGRAIALAAAVVLLNPKSIALFVAAGDIIGTETAAFGEAALAATVFAGTTVAPYAGVAVYQAFGGAAAEERIIAAQRWLQRHGPLIKAVVLGLIAAFFAVKAISGLTEL